MLRKLAVTAAAWTVGFFLGLVCGGLVTWVLAEPL
jgi:hypothetical protein